MFITQVAVFGITGGGKSSTCNTMIGSRERLFEQSSTIMSVTKAVSYRDYAYYKRPCRIIDTPGAGQVRGRCGRGRRTKRN